MTEYATCCGWIVGNFKVVVVPIEPVYRCAKIVVCLAWKVGKRLKCKQGRCCERDRDYVSGEGCTAGSSGSAGGRVIDSLESSIGVAGLREVSGALECGRNGGEARVGLAYVCALPVGKEEELVLLDGAANGSAVLVEDIFGKHGQNRCRLEVITRVDCEMLLYSKTEP